MTIKKFIPILVGLTLIGLSLSMLACGKQDVAENSGFSQRGFSISGGSLVHNTDFLAQSVVALMIQKATGQDVCTGTLIADDTILTSAGCVDDQPSEIGIIFGLSLKDLEKAQIRYGSAYSQNPKWRDSKYKEGDFALVHFNGGRPSDYEPMLLADKTSELIEGTKFTFAGFGGTYGSGREDFGVLRKVDSQILKVLSSSQLVIGGRHGSACFGDAGGPALVRQHDIDTLWGVASSMTARVCGEPALFTNIVDSISWIQSTARELRVKNQANSMSL